MAALVNRISFASVVVTTSTTGCRPFQVIDSVNRVTASTESGSAPFQCCSRLPHQRSTGVSLLG
jgi:hypothetical protein